MATFSVERDDPLAEDVLALLERHLDFARTQSPPEDVHALDPSALTDEAISFFSVRENGVILGVGALQRLDSSHAELKSIHTAERARGRGIGRAIVTHLLDLARTQGYRRVSLETGTMDGFAPSRRLYESFGFEACAPFGNYFESPNSVCMTLELD